MRLIYKHSKKLFFVLCYMTLISAVIAIFSYPVIFKLQSHLIGGNDAYLFTWGIWWFSEILNQFNFSSLWDCSLLLHPFGANLIQHDYPLIACFIGWLGMKSGLTLIGSYNFSVLAAFFLNALSASLLTHTVLKSCKNISRGPADHLLAVFASGLVFAFAPYFWGRSLGHLSLMYAFPLPLTVFSLYKARERNSKFYYAATGFSVVLAVLCQLYYAVFSCFYIIFYFLYESLSVSIKISKREHVHYKPFFMLLGTGSICLLVSLAVVFTGGGAWELMGVKISFRNSINSMMFWWTSWAFALAFMYKPAVKFAYKPGFSPMGILKKSLLIGWPLLVLLPFFIRVAYMVAAGDLASQSISFKTGPQGAYPLSLVMPNMYNFLWGKFLFRIFNEWSILECFSNGLGLASIILVLITKPWRNNKWWLISFAAFTILSLGPFLCFFPGFDHGPVLPFWFLRFIPLINGVRIPSRWIALALVAWSLLVAIGILKLKNMPLRVVFVVLILFESLSIPVPLTAVHLPQAYRFVAEDKSTGALLELPFGLCDGRKSWGENYPAKAMYYQTFHGRPVTGGFLSRIPERIFDSYREQQPLKTLVAWQNSVADASTETAAFKKWLNTQNIAFVILREGTASDVLKEKVRGLLRTPVYSDEQYSVWKIDSEMRN